MTKKNIIVTLLVIALLLLNFKLKPYLRFRDARNTVDTILTYWKNGDLTLAMSYWERETDTPPVYGLTSYTIEEGDIHKENGLYSARFITTLYFPSENLFPSGKKWIFTLNKTRYGWKIVDFHLSQKATTQ